MLCLKCYTVVLKENIALHKVKQARQTFIKTIAMGERLNSPQLNQKAEEFLSALVS